MDERVPRCPLVDLLSELAHAHVDRAVSMGLAPAPDLLEELVASDDAPEIEAEGVQQTELGRRQLGVLAVDEGLHVGRVDAKLLDLDRLAARRALPADAAPCGSAHARHEL